MQGAARRSLPDAGGQGAGAARGAALVAGSNAGTGQPIAFVCAARRREGYRGRSPAESHRVELTGRARKRYGRPGARMTNLFREYRCSCGHVGWSAHVDLARRDVHGYRDSSRGAQLSIRRVTRLISRWVES